MWAEWRNSLLAYLSTGNHVGDATRLLTEWGQEHADDDAMAATVYKAGLQARMAGGLFVRAIEVPESSQVELTGPSPSFMRLPFEEAVREFVARRLVSPAAFQAMSEAERLRSFTATRLATQQIIERAKRLLTETLESGGTMREFIARLESDPAVLGMSPQSPWYMETVYRSNVQSSYGQGRLEQLEAPEVVEARPYVQYRTSGDSRVRPRHRLLNGVIFNRAVDPGWRQFAPPLGFNCRCSVVAVPEHRVDKSRVMNSFELVQRGFRSDDGWSGPGESVSG